MSVRTRCPGCAAPITADESLCAACGLELVCSRCGAMAQPDDSFCAQCGKPLAAGEPMTASPVATTRPPAQPAAGRVAGAAQPWRLPRPVALIGGVAIATSSLLPWIGSGRIWLLGYGIPFHVLLGHQGRGGFSIGLALLIAGACSVGMSFVPRPASTTARMFRAAGSAIPGLIAVSISIIVMIRTTQSLRGGVSLGGVLGAGVYVALVGGAISTASSPDGRKPMFAASIAVGLAALAGLAPIFIVAPGSPGAARGASSPPAGPPKGAVVATSERVLSLSGTRYLVTLDPSADVPPDASLSRR